MSDIALATPAAAPIDLLPDLPDVSTTNQLADAIKIPPHSLEQDRYLRQGIPFVRIGSRIRYLKTDVIAHLLANRVTEQLTP